MALHVVVGKGPVGAGTAQRLVEAGHTVRVLSRSGGTTTDTVEHRAVDAADPVALARDAAGASAIYNAVNPAYDRWAQDWPPVADALLAAAERTGAVLVMMGNLYGYGRPTGVMTQQTPLRATDTKGRVRAQMWDQALAAHAAGRVRVTEARAADFVGPTVPSAQSHLGRIADAVRAGRRAWVIGDPDATRSWAYLPDVTATVVALGTDERAWGRAWHVPTNVPRSQRECAEDLAAAMSRPRIAVSGVPWWALRAAGVVSPFPRELLAVRHQFDQDYVSAAAETTGILGLHATPWAEVVSAVAEKNC